VTDFRGVERVAQEAQRLVIRLQRHWMWMAVLAAVCESETGRIVEATWGAVNHFGDECE